MLGPVLIALASRLVLLTDSIKQPVQQMSKLQLGVGVPNGIEQVIHTVQLGMQLHPNLNFLKTDLSNAFFFSVSFVLYTNILTQYYNQVQKKEKKKLPRLSI